VKTRDGERATKSETLRAIETDGRGEPTPHWKQEAHRRPVDDEKQNRLRCEAKVYEWSIDAGCEIEMEAASGKPDTSARPGRKN